MGGRGQHEYELSTIPRDKSEGVHVVYYTKHVQASVHLIWLPYFVQ